MAYGIRRYGLLDLIPVARGALIETMPDGALVFDAQGRLVDSNPAAREALRLALGQLPTPLLGQPMSALLRFPPAGDEGRARANGHAEVRLGAGEGGASMTRSSRRCARTTARRAAIWRCCAM